jgi:glycosyltransferase involved in cell wall biosynthesis
MDELISVVVSTYNWPEALDLSLKSLSAQTDSNFEIIVADDGSGCETARVVEGSSSKTPVPKPN